MSGDVMLELCPFCGAEPKKSRAHINPRAICPTDGCIGARQALVLDDPNQVAAWNRRSSSAAERAVVEARREGIEKAAAYVESLAESYQTEAGAWFNDLTNKLKYGYQASVLRYAAKAIRALSSVRGEGGDKQATRASGPTAPTDRLQSKE